MRATRFFCATDLPPVVVDGAGAADSFAGKVSSAMDSYPLLFVGIISLSFEKGYRNAEE
jgi:hypothetical protein